MLKMDEKAFSAADAFDTFELNILSPSLSAKITMQLKEKT
jgi:hypothetical protein